MISNFASPHIGGVEKVVTKLSEHLKGHEVTIITEKHEESLKNVEKFNKWTKVYRFSYPHKKYIGLFYIWKWMWENRKLIQDADLVHIHDVFIWYLPFRFLFPFKPVYTTYHGWEGKFPIPLPSLIQKKLAFYLSKRTIVVGKYLEKYYGLKANSVIHNGTDIPREQSKKVPQSFVWVGRLSYDTGLDIVLDALSKIKNINIEFCGDGELRAECEKYGKVHGFVVDPRPFLLKAEFCFAGGYITTLDAFAHNCLVFLCYQNKIKEDCFRMTPFAKYMVIESSPQNLVKKIKYFQTHPKEKKELVDKAYKWVQSQTWENVANQYEKLWNVKT